MKSLQELMSEALITEKNVSVDADVIFKGGKKEQEKMEQKFGIKFKFKRGNDCTISGPKENVKKYILKYHASDRDDAEFMFPSLFESALTEKNITLDADVIFDGGAKEQKETEKKFGIKFKFRRGHECDITGPIDKVKKYILSPDGYNLDKLDAEDMFPELFESKQDNLTEALKFKDEPADDYRALYTEYAKRLSKIAKDTVADAKNGNTDTFLDSLITKLKNANIAASIILDYNSGQIGDDEKAFNKVKSYIEKV